VRYVHGTDPAELSDTLQTLLYDDVALGDLAERGRTRSGDFSWEQTAALTIEGYKRLAS
jgi:glycosyltransferase involved in cell wall biosynthesis